MSLVNHVLGLKCKLCARVVPERESPFQGEVELDESYFGARRVRGRRGRGALGKTIVFGLLKRGGRVYTRIVPDVSRKTLMSVVERQVDKEAIVYT